MNVENSKYHHLYFNSVFTIVFFVFFLQNSLAQNHVVGKPSPHSVIEQIRKKYASDRRTSIFQIEIDSNRIVGKTNLPIAKKELINRFKSVGYDYKFYIKLLPDEKELESKTEAIVNISVANLRATPKESSELVTQALLGSSLKILDREKYWYQVQTPDKYIGWVEGMTIKRVNQEEKSKYNSSPKIIFTKPYGFSYADSTENTQTISDLTWGDLLVITDTLSGLYKITYPDSRVGFVSKKETQHFIEWQINQNPTAENLKKTAKSMMGLPYLWGGTSWKGVDCSGFTKLIFQTHGILLPRDASQQAQHGLEIDTSKGFENLSVGDLLFFGEKATDDKPEKVVHVGMWIGENQFIHSSGMVRISSFDKNSPKFDSFNLGRYLKTKRILNTSEFGDSKIR